MADNPDIVPAMGVDGELFTADAPLHETVAASPAISPDVQTEMVDDGESDMTPREKLLATQRKYATLLRQRNEAKQGNSEPKAASPPTYDEPADDLPVISFATQETTYKRKKRLQTLTMRDEVEYMQASAAEAARIRKAQADVEYDRSPTPEPIAGIFVSEDEHEPPPRLSDMVSDYDEEEETLPKKRGRKRASPDGDNDLNGQSGPRKRGRPKGSGKKARKVDGTNYTDQAREDVLDLARKKAAKPIKKKAPAKTKAKAASKRKATDRTLNMSSLLGTDVFKDTAAVKDLPDQPRFEKSGGPREKALATLIASLPAESKKAAASDRRYLDDCIKDFNGHASVRPHADGNWSVRGMRSTLKHYQIAGVAFMRRRENEGKAPRGGILADQMGLGKTVMMLANIVNGKPSEKSKHRATLIVASPALVGQWAAEIEKHALSKREHKAAGLGNVIQYRAGARLASNNNLDMLESADIVLTTYHEVSRSYPKAILPPELVTAQQKDAFWTSFYEENKGILHRVKFHRVVLDEAQAIKNHRSHTSMSCRAINAKHHWAITGTPILNNIKEFYPYFKFLREPSTGSYRIFKENFCSPDDLDGSVKLSVFLRKFMIRRTHIDRFFDARLLDLPTPKEHTLWLEFNEVERQIYEIVKRNFVKRINMISKQSGLEKQFSNIWVMILRLRQICGHSLLVQSTLIDLLEREDLERLSKITETEGEQTEEGASLLVHLRHVLKNNSGTKTINGDGSGAVITESETVPIDLINVEDAADRSMAGHQHGKNFRFRPYLKSLMESEHGDAINKRCLCTGCRQPPKNPHVTSCFHIYCLPCLEDLQHLAARRGHDQARCSECGEAYHSVTPCQDDIDAFQRQSTTQSPADSRVAVEKGKKKKSKPKDSMEDWISMSGEILPSAKTTAVKAQLMNWFAEDPKCKVIVYSQFLPLIRILGKLCETERYGYVRYTGEMSQDNRTNAIKEFGEDPEKRIMLASLRCGGLGLNLTMASKVICLDPWWNAAVEQQAFCRVFRIGQTETTEMTRLVVRNTVDEAMMAMKERKQIDIDAVMTESQRKEVLSVSDLMRLFGPVGEDSDGKPFIFAEGDAEDEDGAPELQRLANIDSEDEDPIQNEE